MAEQTAHAKCEMVEEGIALVTLNRPERGNAHTKQMREELDSIYRRCDEDDTVRVIVVTGAGKAFCVGADLGSGSTTFDVDAGHNEWQRVLGFQLKKPVIGAINGHAVGIGLTMTLNWDYVIVAESAKLAFPFVRRGIGPNWAAPGSFPASWDSPWRSTSCLPVGHSAAPRRRPSASSGRYSPQSRCSPGRWSWHGISGTTALPSASPS
jgi:enoyl-CoA hydratase/carnithine racemase